MGFGSTLGGMGYASEGMDQGAEQANRRVMMQNANDASALQLRQMQEQDAANRAQREASAADLANLKTPGADLPQAEAGNTLYAGGGANDQAGPPAPAAPGAPKVTGPSQGTTSSLAAAEQARLDASREQLRQYQLANAGEPPSMLDKTASTGKGPYFDPAVRNSMPNLGKFSPYGASMGGSQRPDPTLAKTDPKEAALQRQIAEGEANLKRFQDQSADAREQKMLPNTGGGAPAAAGPVAPGATINPAQAAPAAAAPGSMQFADALRYVESRGNMNAVSSKGAKSDMQVMDKTNANPGFGVAPARDDSLEERSRVGRDYAAALLNRYKDPAAAAAAYNMGPGAYDKWVAAGKDPNAMPAETRAYVQQVLPLLQQGAPATAPTQVASATPNVASATPAVAAAPTQTPGFQAQGQATAQGGPNINQDVSQAVQMFNLVKQQAMNTYDPVQKAALLQHLTLMGQSIQDMQLMNIARNAQFNPEAMNQLVGLVGGQAGVKLAVMQDGKGNGQIVREDGTPLPGQWGQPMPLEQIANAMHQELNKGLQAKAAQFADLYSTAKATAGGKAAGEQGLELAKINAQGANNAFMAQIHSDGATQLALMQAGLTADNIKGASPTGSMNGDMMVHTNKGVYLYQQPPAAVPGKPAGIPKLIPLSINANITG